MKYEIDENLLKAVGRFLGGCPYSQVAVLVQELNGLTPINEKAKKD